MSVADYIADCTQKGVIDPIKTNRSLSDTHIVIEAICGLYLLIF